MFLSDFIPDFEDVDTPPNLIEFAEGTSEGGGGPVEGTNLAVG
jgi:hypothetical protein